MKRKLAISIISFWIILSYLYIFWVIPYLATGGIKGVVLSHIFLIFFSIMVGSFMWAITNI